MQSARPLPRFPFSLSPILILNLILALMAGPLSGLPDEGKPGEIHTQEAAKAGIDFELQGEYAGEIILGDENVPVGIQVVALGQGKFQGKGFPGGLPGAGAVLDDPPRKLSGERKEETAVLKVEKRESDEPDLVIEIAKGQAAVKLVEEDRVLGTLKKIHRKSPTLGLKPPSGAIVIFGGTPGPGVPADRVTENGELRVGGPGGKPFTSIQKFQDARIHLEFRTPFRPKARGQNRGNSGVYVQERYEVQVLDSFGLKGTHNEAGGIYSVADPLHNLCLPPLTWQTYDIEFRAARFDEKGTMTEKPRMTVKFNGVVVHDDVEITGKHQPELKGTTAAPKRGGPEPRGLYLQQHGSSLLYRNIWFVPLDD